MKLGAVLFIAAVVVAGGLAANVPVELWSYHEKIGIPAYERIKQLEQGRDFDGSRIGGGTIVGAGRHPYIVGVVVHLPNNIRSTCTAALLTNTRSLTAAHCWFAGSQHATSFDLVFGSAFLMTGGVRVSTNQVAIHAEWTPMAFRDDIAVATHAWVSYTNVINNIHLPSGSDLDQSFAGFTAVASGFGRISNDPPPANPDKRELTVQVITNAVCRQTMGFFITDQILCTAPQQASSVCSGDSGGPLAVGSGNNRVLIGILSFGPAACPGTTPAAYTRVTAYISWIISRL